ncbi:MAG: efflux RND transporter periplasmic adaptor subunit [Pseudomonadota bacterium]
MRQIPCLIAFALAMSGGAALAQGGPSAVGVQTVEERMLAETVPVFAEVITARDGSVASRVAGTVEAVNVLAGARVETGDILVELDRELLEIIVAQSEAQLTEAEAGIATARVRLDRASTTFARIEALRGSSSFSQGRFDDAQSDVLEAQSQLTEAQARTKSTEAQLAEARYQLDRSTIIAPFPGIVIEVDTIPGAFISAGTPVVRLLDVEAFEVEASVPSRYLGELSPGQELQATTEKGDDLTLELRAILPLEDVTTRTRAVRLTAPGLGALSNIAVGQSITVQIPVGAARSILSVPKDALVQAQGGWTVFIANDGKAEPRTVQIGLPMGDRYEVVNGLTEGDIVVVRGNERLRPGQDIAPNIIESN